MLNITRFPLQISISSPSRPGVNHLQWPASLTQVTARSEWGDFSGNALTGESLTHSPTEEHKCWLCCVCQSESANQTVTCDSSPNQRRDNSLRMTQRMSQRHYRHWVRDIRTRGSLCWPLRLINIASTATRASRGWWNGGCRGNMGQNATITFISSTIQIPLVWSYLSVL